MLKRCLYTVIFGALLAVAATFVPPTDAQAMSSSCACPAGECRCCCKQGEAEDSAAVLLSPGMAAAETCTCSAGPNPFSTDESVATVFVDPPKKRFFQTLAAAAAAAVPSAPEGLRVKRYKPPAISSQRLYLLNSSFLV